MKKFASLILALAMTFSLCISAGAVSPIEALGNGDGKPVTLTVRSTAEGAVVYYVAVTWKSLDFTYETQNTKGVWDPDTHSYSGGSSAGWKTTNEYDVVEGDTITRHNAVTVTNHSNAPVAVSAAANVGNAVSGITMITAPYNNLSQSLPSAEGKATDAAELVVGYDLSVEITDASALNAGDDQEIGTVVVSIAAPTTP